MVVFNIFQRTEIIQKFKAGYQAKSLAFEYGVGQSAIYDITKEGEKLKNHKIENPNSYMKSTFKE